MLHQRSCRLSSRFHFCFNHYFTLTFFALMARAKPAPPPPPDNNTVFKLNGKQMYLYGASPVVTTTYSTLHQVMLTHSHTHTHTFIQSHISHTVTKQLLGFIWGHLPKDTSAYGLEELGIEPYWSVDDLPHLLSHGGHSSVNEASSCLCIKEASHYRPVYMTLKQNYNFLLQSAYRERRQVN